MRLHVKNRFWINTALSSIFATLVMACGGGGTTTPTASSVLVSGPAAATLKINEGTAFTAVAKDSSGAAITGKAFTWASSDTNIATVDTGGIVTAKRIGTVKISATTESITGEGAVQKTYGLEMSGGLYKDPTSTVPGTAFIAKLGLADGTNPVTATIITVIGPSGWNAGGISVTSSYPASQGFTYFFRSLIPAINGTYVATATVSGENYGSKFEIKTDNSIEPATSLIVNVAKTQADASWTAPVNAAGYIARIWQDNGAANDTIVTGANFRTPASSQQFRNITLDPTKQYYLEVTATNAVWSPGNSPSLPTQFNLSRVISSSNFSPAP